MCMGWFWMQHRCQTLCVYGTSFQKTVSSHPICMLKNGWLLPWPLIQHLTCVAHFLRSLIFYLIKQLTRFCGSDASAFAAGIQRGGSAFRFRPRNMGNIHTPSERPKQYLNILTASTMTTNTNSENSTSSRSIPCTPTYLKYISHFLVIPTEFPENLAQSSLSSATAELSYSLALWSIPSQIRPSLPIQCPLPDLP
jgi:hypothetical protein